MVRGRAGLALFQWYVSRFPGVINQRITVILLTVFKEDAEVLQLISDFYSPFTKKVAGNVLFRLAQMHYIENKTCSLHVKVLPVKLKTLHSEWFSEIVVSRRIISVEYEN
jgi:hypothetical protein